MKKCDYCGRYFKEIHETCPGCGSTSFQNISNFGTIKITDVPQGGYKLDTDNFKSDKKLFSIFYYAGIVTIAMGIIFSIIPLLFSIVATGNDFFGITFALASISICIVTGLPFILIGKYGIKKYKKNIEKLNILSQKGILIKNMPYEIKPTGTVVNNQRVYAIEVQYELDNGTKIPLRSEAKYDGILARPDGTVDLLIDPNDISNYFIDFEIY